MKTFSPHLLWVVTAITWLSAILFFAALSVDLASGYGYAILGLRFSETESFRNAIESIGIAANFVSFLSGLSVLILGNKVHHYAVILPFLLSSYILFFVIN
jgi:hypothetical protein